MISIKLVIGPTHGKCLLTRIPRNKHKKSFFQGNTRKDHPPICFSDIPVTQTTVQKHIEMYLDEKLNYNTHVKEKLSKVYKGIGLLRSLSNKLPIQALVTIYKTFIRPQLDYGDIVYDKPDNEIFINKIKKAQYDAVLAISGAIRGTSREKTLC